VLLQRTPYNKDADVGFELKAAGRGYVVIIQDVRGRYASVGATQMLAASRVRGIWQASVRHNERRPGIAHATRPSTRTRDCTA
jgi:X-Pro dipeptidyl-peptidase (S15 family)